MTNEPPDLKLIGEDYSDSDTSSSEEEDIMGFLEGADKRKEENRKYEERMRSLKVERERQEKERIKAKKESKIMKERKKKRRDEFIKREIGKVVEITSGKDVQQKIEKKSKVLGNCLEKVCRKESDSVLHGTKYAKVSCNNSRVGPCTIILHYDCWNKYYRNEKKERGDDILCPNEGCGFSLTTLVHNSTNNGAETIVSLVKEEEIHEMPRMMRVKRKKTRRKAHVKKTSRKETEEEIGEEGSGEESEGETEEEEEEEGEATILKFSDEDHIKKVLEKEEEVKKSILQNVIEMANILEQSPSPEEKEDDSDDSGSEDSDDEGIVVSIRESHGIVMTPKRKYLFPLSEVKTPDGTIRINDRVSFQIVEVENVLKAHKVRLVQRITERSRVIQMIVENPDTVFEGIITDINRRNCYVKFGSHRNLTVRYELKKDDSFLQGDVVCFNILPINSKNLIASNLKKKSSMQTE